LPKDEVQKGEDKAARIKMQALNIHWKNKYAILSKKPIRKLNFTAIA